MNQEKLKNNAPCAMTIAGSDSGAGAGIQADLLSFAANQVYGCTAIVAITAQNPNGVTMIEALTKEMVKAQLKAICDFYKPTAAKTGMLFNAQIVESVADFFQQNAQINLVVDPVMIATSGAKLLKDDAICVLKKRLLPLAKLITPNLDEAAFLLGVDEISNPQESAIELSKIFKTNVLLKGGHSKSDIINDILANENGIICQISSQRIKSINTHGSGCTLSAAITANLAKGLTIEDSCKNARTYLLAGIENKIKVGGQNFINHFPSI